MAGIKGKTGKYKRTILNCPEIFLKGDKSIRWKGGEKARRKTEKYKEFHKRKFYEWCKKNPERWSILKRNVRIKRMGAEGSFTKEEWDKKKKEYNNKCFFCGISGYIVNLTVDHIIPLSKGGTNYIENIQPLCKSCNSKKGNKLNYEH